MGLGILHRITFLPAALAGLQQPAERPTVLILVSCITFLSENLYIRVCLES